MRRMGWFGIGGLLLAGALVAGCNCDRFGYRAPVTQPYAGTAYPYPGTVYPSSNDSGGAYGGAAPPAMAPPAGSGPRTFSTPQGSPSIPQGSGSR